MEPLNLNKLTSKLDHTLQDVKINDMDATTCNLTFLIGSMISRTNHHEKANNSKPRITGKFANERNSFKQNVIYRQGILKTHKHGIDFSDVEKA